MSPSDLSVLLDPRRPSGYRGVYRHRDRWQARAQRRRGRSGGGSPVIGTYDTPEAAAWAVAAWWERAYGPHWPEAFRRRTTTGWRVAYSDRLGGAVVTAWPFGCPHTVAVIRRPRPRTGEEWRELVRLVRETVVWPWLWREYGLTAPAVLWRGPAMPRRPVSHRQSRPRLRDDAGRFAVPRTLTPVFPELRGGFALAPAECGQHSEGAA